MEAFRAPMMPLIEPTVLLAPSLTAASRPEQSGIVIADPNGFVHSLTDSARSPLALE
jgi:hypothetical protein